MPFLLVFLFILVLAGYYLPIAVHLVLRYDRGGLTLRLRLEMLGGLWRRERRFDAASGARERTGEYKPKAGADLSSLLAQCDEIRRRFVAYGLGGTLLSYFVPAKYRDWMHVAEELEKKGRLVRLHWRTAIGLQEAAATAWAVGLAWAVKGQVLSLLHRQYGLRAGAVEIGVRPSFTAPVLGTSLDCIFSFRAGHIIRAVLLGFLLHKMGRSVPWHDRRPPDRGAHEDGDAEHQGNG